MSKRSHRRRLKPIQEEEFQVGEVDWVKVFFVLGVPIIIPILHIILFITDPIAAVYGFKTSLMLRMLHSMK